jgi:hypothetical protein
LDHVAVIVVNCGRDGDDTDPLLGPDDGQSFGFEITAL